MATNNDVRNFEHGHRVLDRRRTPALHRTVRRYHVTGVPKNKELARLCLSKQRGIDAGIRTGNKQRVRFLLLGQACKEVFLFAEDFAAELREAFEEFFHLSTPILPATVRKLTIDREDEDPFSQLHVDIGKDPQDLGPGDLADLLAKLVPPLCNQILP